jgi:hypothetical protein
VSTLQDCAAATAPGDVTAPRKSPDFPRAVFFACGKKTHITRRFASLPTGTCGGALPPQPSRASPAICCAISAVPPMERGTRGLQECLPPWLQHILPPPLPCGHSPPTSPVAPPNSLRRRVNKWAWRSAGQRLAIPSRRRIP